MSLTKTTNDDLLLEIEWHLKRDHVLIPLNKSRIPVILSWSKLTFTDADAIKAHARGGGNVGWVIRDSALVVDVDVKNGHPGVKSMHKLQHLMVFPPPDRKVFSPSGGYHLYYLNMVKGKVFHTHLEGFEGIDFLTGPRYVVIGGCTYGPNLHDIDPTKRYRVDPDLLEPDEPTAPPIELLVMLERPKPEPVKADFVGKDKVQLLDVQVALAALDPELLSRDHWLQVGMALKEELEDDGFELFDEWSQRDPARYQAQRSIDQDWRSFNRSEGALAGFGKIEWLVQYYGEEFATQRVQKEAPHLFQLGSAFLATNPPPIQYRLEQFLPEQFIAMVFAKRGVGKTWFAYQIVRALVLGEPLLGWAPGSALKLKRVLFVDGELPTTLLHARMKAILADASDQFYLFSVLDFYKATETAFNLNRPDHQKFLNRKIKELGIDLVVLDNKSSLFLGSDENEGGGAEQPIQWMTRLREDGVSTLLVHHAGKSGAQRGSSRWEDQLDLVIQLQEMVDHQKRVIAEQFKVVLDKVRYRRPDQDLVVAKIVSFDDETRVVLQEVVERTVADEDDLELLALIDAGKSRKEIALELKVTERTVQRKCSELTALLFKDPTKKGNEFPYALTEKGLEALRGVAFDDFE